jgi:hypothetical protein
MPSAGQYRAVRQPHHAGGYREEGSMRGTRHGAQRSGTAGSQLKQQLGFESDMGEFIGNDGSAKNLQALAIRDRFKRAIIHLPNQFGADEHAYVQLQSGEPPYESKNSIGTVGFLRPDSVILHESPQ